MTKEEFRQLDKIAYRQQHLSDEEFSQWLNFELPTKDHETLKDYEADAAAFYRRKLYNTLVNEN